MRDAFALCSLQRASWRGRPGQLAPEGNAELVFLRFRVLSRFEASLLGSLEDNEALHHLVVRS